MTKVMAQMPRDEILENLQWLGKRLEERNLRGELILTSGASMCLVHSARVTGQDYNDISFLFGKLQISSIEEAQNIVEKCSPAKMILP